MRLDGPPPRPKPPEIVRLKDGPSLTLILLLLALAIIANLIAVSLANAATAPTGRVLDLEKDIGLVAESQSAAANNTAKLSAALNAQWSGGKFKFANGAIGPILQPIRAAAKEFFFAGTIETSTRVGGALYGFGSRGYPIVSGHYGPGGTLGGATTRFTRIDGQAGGAVLRLRGTGFTLDGIELRGRPYLDDPTGEGPKTGTKTPVGIEVEGRQYPATGHHVIRNCTIDECTYGICARAGYYENGQLIPCEQHADNSIVDGVIFFNVESCLRSENQQALVWRLRDVAVGGYGGTGQNETIVLDIMRGGDAVVDGLSLNHGRATLVNVRDYSPNTRFIAIYNLRVDTMSGGYLTLFNYDKTAPTYDDMDWLKWTVRITGHIANSDVAPSYDATRLVCIPACKVKRLNMDDIKVDVALLPMRDPARTETAALPAWKREGNWYTWIGN